MSFGGDDRISNGIKALKTQGQALRKKSAHVPMQAVSTFFSGGGAAGHLRAHDIVLCRWNRSEMSSPSKCLWRADLARCYSHAHPSRLVEQVHVNTGTSARVLSMLHRVIFASSKLVMLLSLAVYVSCTVIFAAFFYALGETCYKLGARLSTAATMRAV